MLYQKEIADIAEKTGVTKSTIDKDWVLGHFVNAIFNFEPFRKQLIFKGGTCLRKCYYENYRFSEDLDFTAIQKNFVLNHKSLEKLCENVTNSIGVKLHIKNLKELKHKGQKTGFQATIKFWGADHSRNQKPPEPARWQTKIKIETILFEKLLFKPLNKNIIHPYSDADKINTQAVCYSLKEVMSEKLRAMIQRSYTAPRDYYDVWYLSKTHVFDHNEIREAFLEKMKYKGLTFESTTQFINEKAENILKKHWENALGSHLPDGLLPKSNEVLKDLQIMLDKLFKKK